MLNDVGLLKRHQKSVCIPTQERGNEKIRTHTDKDTVPVPELVGKKRLLMKKFSDETRFYAFPPGVLDIIPPQEGYVRKGRDKLPLQISRPPHLIVNQARWFAVYSDEFIAVPPKQIGISGKSSKKMVLKALALYLMSDFARYYEFFHSQEIGVQESISSLRTLKNLPVPFFSENMLETWAQLYDALATTENFSGNLLETDMLQVKRRELERQANDLVCQALVLSTEECMLVHDLVHERRKLLRGKISQELLQAPAEAEIRAYIQVLKKQLDDFLGDEDGEQHAISVIYHNPSAMLEIRLLASSVSDTLQISKANQPLAREFADLHRRLLRQHSQWLYFERNLTVFDGDRTYLFKPMERLYWLPSQALTDASDLIATILSSEND
ncbi:MAG: hypothetical protein GY862_01740 [Gammaproteobacteria bacterium]|nr:hypothetical protein [Gammaproteobacteria bacterium]